MINRVLCTFAVFCLCACSTKQPEPAKSPTASKTPTTKVTAPASQPAASQPSASQPMKAADSKARVFFVWPEDGATVPTTFDVAFGLEGMKIAKAGTGLQDKTLGHHHLIIDGAGIKYGSAVPMDERHLHFGKGQTQTSVTLTPGKHTLTMQFADGAHRSFGAGLSATITVNVVDTKAKPAVKFLEPADGATVKSPVKVKFGITGLTISPAGTAPSDKTKGHHHVVVDGAVVPLGTVVPADDRHIHFGKGQTEAELKLAPGKHTLTLQFADGAHRSYGAAVSQTISVMVE